MHEKKYQESFTAPDAHVLVVDDNAMNLKVVQSLLKQTQVQIDTAEDGAGCLEKCARNHYDLILMDHLMPNMDGIEAFHRLRADKQGINYKTPVIILTANAVAGMKQKYMEEGFNGFLSKPVQGPLLEKTLKQYLPEELVTLTEQEQADDAEEQEQARRQVLRQAVDDLRLADMDLDDALQYSSGLVTDVLDNIKGYLTDSEANRERIKKEYEAENWNDFKIHVHALKSTSRIVGAVHMAYLAEQMEKAAGNEDVTYITGNFENLLEEHEQLCMDLEHLLAVPAVRDMAPIRIEVEQETGSYLAEVERFLQEVAEYDVDFECLRTFCNCYPAGMSLKEEREQLTQAVENFDYESIQRSLEQIAERMKTN